MKYKIFILLFLFLIDISPAMAGDTYFRLCRVKVVGAKAIPEKEFIKTLSAAVPNRYKFWVPKPVLSEEDILDDVQKIKKFYQASGYHDIRVEYVLKKIKDIPQKPSKKKPDDPSEASQIQDPIPSYDAEVQFTLTEGARTLVNTIEIRMEGAPADFHEEHLRSKLSITLGRPFEIEKYRESKVFIEKEMENSGYPFSKVTGNVVVDMRSNTAEVSFHIVPGQKCRFGELAIIRKELPVQEAIIHRAISFHPGEGYEAKKIEESQRNLYDLDVFKSALLKAEEVVPGTDTVPMRLEIKPKKRQSVKFGVGYGSEDGVRLKSGWTYRNIGGWAGRLSMNGKRSDIYEGIWGDYTQPFLWDSKSNLRVTAGGERETLDSYVNQKAYGNVNLTRKLPQNWRILFGYNLEINKLEDVTVTDPYELMAFEKDNNYWISSLVWGVTQNTTDNEINPTKGHIASLTVETASGLFGSSLSFVKPDLDLRLYQPIPFEMVVAGRVHFQSLQEIGDTDYIPIFKRLFLGGSNTVRGYGYQKLGPLDDAGKPLGGLSSMNASVELRRPLYESFSGALFFDMGQVEAEAFHYNFGEIRYTGGVGFRYDTPVGPIRVDWGYKLNPDEKDEDRWRLHFSVGQAF